MYSIRCWLSAGIINNEANETKWETIKRVPIQKMKIDKSHPHHFFLAYTLTPKRRRRAISIVLHYISFSVGHILNKEPHFTKICMILRNYVASMLWTVRFNVSYLFTPLDPRQSKLDGQKVLWRIATEVPRNFRI